MANVGRRSIEDMVLEHDAALAGVQARCEGHRATTDRLVGFQADQIAASARHEEAVRALCGSLDRLRTEMRDHWRDGGGGCGDQGIGANGAALQAMEERLTARLDAMALGPKVGRALVWLVSTRLGQALLGVVVLSAMGWLGIEMGALKTWLGLAMGGER